MPNTPTPDNARITRPLEVGKPPTPTIPRVLPVGKPPTPSIPHPPLPVGPVIKR